jgi:hypothetical protein
MNGNIPGVIPIDIHAAFPSIATGRLVNRIEAVYIDGDLIPWMECFLSESMVVMVMDCNAMERHPVEVDLPLGSPVSPIC